jgi:hypothetical protein
VLSQSERIASFFPVPRLFQSLFQRLPSPPLPCLDLCIPFNCKCNFATLIDFFYERTFEFAEGSYDHLLTFHVLAAFYVIHNIPNFTTDLLHAIPKPSESSKNLMHIMNSLWSWNTLLFAGLQSGRI